MKIIFFVFFTLFISNSYAFIPNLIDIIEKQIIHNTVANCTSGKILTNTEYEDLKNIAKVKMNGVSLSHYVNGKEVKYYLPFAFEGIKSSTAYDKSKPLSIVIHGYFGNVLALGVVHKEIINELKILNNTNVFALDHNIMMVESYYTASTNVIFVGEALGQLLANLYKSGYSNFHLIGHSLGAHVSGYAGKVFTTLTGKKLDRITGLDPAGPCFFVQPAEKRLTTTDANFVDVIHSDLNTLGINISIGHTDFYPNSGENMGGCLAAKCSHDMSIRYYAESINNNKFLSVKCTNWKTFMTGACSVNEQKPMGYWTPSSTRGDFYLRTNWFSKYAMGVNGIKP